VFRVILYSIDRYEIAGIII